MRYSTRALSPVVASLALLGCGESVIVFQAVTSDGIPTPYDPSDAAADDAGPSPLRAASADAHTHALEPLGDDAGPDEAPAGESDSVDGSAGCANDPRVDEYTSDLTKLGAQRALRFILAASRPAPPWVGSNVLTFRIVTSDSASLVGDSKPFRGDLRAHLTMPDHGHPTTVQPTITLDTSTDEYTVDPAYLFMAGVWRIELDAYFTGSSETDAPVDTAAYHFCVVGHATTLGPGGL